MSKTMVQGSERIDLDILKDAIREVVREELDQLTMQQSGSMLVFGFGVCMVGKKRGSIGEIGCYSL